LKSLSYQAILISLIQAALDATSLSVALPIIAQKLKGTAIEAFWSGTSFLLTSTVFQVNNEKVQFYNINSKSKP
jgi:putative Ca2+/H+ antiporter (TMEM165/GDT1 family)